MSFAVDTNPAANSINSTQMSTPLSSHSFLSLAIDTHRPLNQMVTRESGIQTDTEPGDKPSPPCLQQPRADFASVMVEDCEMKPVSCLTPNTVFLWGGMAASTVVCFVIAAVVIWGMYTLSLHNHQRYVAQYAEYTIIFAYGFLRTFMMQFHDYILRSYSATFRAFPHRIQKEVAWLFGRSIVFCLLFPVAVYIYEQVFHLGPQLFALKYGAYGKTLIGIAQVDYIVELQYRQGIALRVHHLMGYTIAMLCFEWLPYRDPSVLCFASQDILARLVYFPIVLVKVCLQTRRQQIFRPTGEDDGLLILLRCSNTLLRYMSVFNFIYYTFFVRAAMVGLIVTYNTKFYASIGPFFKIANPIICVLFILIDYQTYQLLLRRCYRSYWKRFSSGSSPISAM